MTVLHLDFELRSRCDLVKRGTWNYSIDPSTEILCLSYAIDGGEPVICHPPIHGLPAMNWPPMELIELSQLPDTEIHAHNAFFERCIWLNICHKRLGWPAVDPMKWRCTLAICAYHALPRKLEHAGIALKMKHQKDMEGARILKLFMGPMKNGQWFWDPVLFRKLCSYCATDVRVEREIGEVLGPLPEYELKIWLLDQKINEHGILFDKDLARVAIETADSERAKANVAIYNLTGGKVASTTSQKDFKDWALFEGYDFHGKSISKDTLPDYLANPSMPGIIKEALKIKSSVSAASVNKYKAILNLMDPDGVIRDTLRYGGAGTMRWAGKGVQIQNFPRGYGEEMEEICQWIGKGDLAAVEMFYGDKPMAALKKATRGSIIARPGHEILAPDYSAIEARGLMWAVGDEEAIYQLKFGDIYCDMASSLYGYKVNKKQHPAERQMGKAIILGCFGAETEVLTDTGWKRIVEVTKQDRLWDGDNWVSHGGVLDQGLQECIDLDGVAVTPDHLILTELGWKSASQVQDVNLSYRKSALKLACSRLPDIYTENEAELSKSKSSVNATPKLSTVSIRQISECGSQLDVILAQKRNQIGNENYTIATPTSLTMTSIESDCLTGFHLRLAGATTQETTNINTTGNVALRSLNPGGTIGGHSSPTPSHFQGGTIPVLKSTESMLMEGANQVTSDSQLEKKTSIIKDPSQTSKQKYAGLMNVYDILNSGNQNRFMIRTAAGPLIVHNCGYGMGYPKFLLTIQKDRITLGEKLVRQLVGDRFEEIKKFVSGEAPRISDMGISVRDNWIDLIGCKFIVDTYRAKYPKVKAWWRELEDAARNAILDPGVIKSAGKVSYLYNPEAGNGQGFLHAILPSGRYINYFKPYLEPSYMITFYGRNEKGREVKVSFQKDRITGNEAKQAAESLKKRGYELTSAEPNIWESQKIMYYRSDKGGMYPSNIYSGLCAENVVQAVSRDLIAEAMLRSYDRGYMPIFTVHDELAAETKIGTISVKAYEDLICELPAWAEGFPIAAEGMVVRRYRK